MTQSKTISRRAFLLLSGATAAMTVLANNFPMAFADSISLPGLDSLMGRALNAAAIYERPAASAGIVGRVWPDAMLPLRAQVSTGNTGGRFIKKVNDWYALDEGYIRCLDVQPMLAYAPNEAVLVDNFPAAVTVIAPVAVVRRWVGGVVSPVARIGYGGVLWAVDRLVDDGGQLWYGVAAGPDETPLGWTRSAFWSAVPTSPAQVRQIDRELVLNRDQHQVLARAGGQTVFSVPAVVPEQAAAAQTVLTGRTLSGQVGIYSGVPWCLMAGDTLIHGAYWHNDFGNAADCTGWEVSPWAARWLYDWLPDGAPVRVV